MLAATMGGERALVGRFASQLRCELWAAFLGVPAPPAPPARATEVDPAAPSAFLRDPLAEATFSRLQATAAKNCAIFERVFACYPHDSIQVFGDLRSRRAARARRSSNVSELQEEVAKNKARLQEVSGTLVPYPTRFLVGEGQSLNLGTDLVPDQIFQ